MTHSLTRTITAFVAALIAALGLCLAGLAPQSSALPPGGAADSSAGTSSTVSSPVEVGGTVEFTLSGFPVGSTVSIKIDDGQGYSDQGTQFTGVVHQGVVPSSGTLSGSFQLPSFVEPGEHWLRFLTSVAVDTDGGGYQGYSNKSPNFTVVEAGSTSGGSNNSSGGSNSGGSGSGSNSGGSQSGSDSDGGVVYVDEEGATITQGATSNGSSSNSGNSSNSSSSSSESAEASAEALVIDGSEVPSTTASSAASSAADKDVDETAEESESNGFPTVGVVVLLLALLVVAAGVLMALRSRSKAESAAEAPTVGNEGDAAANSEDDPEATTQFKSQ